MDKMRRQQKRETGEATRPQNQELERAIRSAAPEFALPSALEARILAAADAAPVRRARPRWRLVLGGAVAAAVVAALLFVCARPGAPMVVVTVAKPPVSGAWGRAVRVGDKLPAGATVRTGQGGRVTLLTRQGSELTLNANTELALDRDAHGADLRRGEVYCRNRRHEIARIDTSAGHIALLGTTLDVAEERPEKVAVTVVDGTVRLGNDHGEAVVAAGRRSVLVSSLAPEEGTAVDTASTTSWYSGKLDIVSDYGEIAYHLIRESGRVLEVWAMNADGSHKHLVKRYVGESFDAAGPWLPGQQWLLVWTDNAFPQLTQGRFNSRYYYLLGTATGQDVALALPANYRVWQHALSPDGRQLALSGYFQSDPPSLGSRWKAGIWRYDLATGHPTELADFRASGLAWAPDGKRLAISYGAEQGCTEEEKLALMDAESGAVTDLGGHGVHPCFSPDGRRLAYSGDYHQDPNDHNIRTGRVFVLDLESAEAPVPISPGNQSVVEIRWSPDGSRVAYRTEDMKPDNPDGGPANMTLRLYVAMADGAETREVYHADTWTRAISWAPAGDALYVATADGGLAKGVLLVAADGSGLIADLGGSPKDSVATAVEQGQVKESYKVLREVEDLQTKAWYQAYSGKAEESSISYHRISALLTRLPWNYPLAAFSHDSLLRYSDVADTLAARSPEEVLRDGCAYRMTLIANKLSGGREPLPSADEFRDRPVQDLRNSMPKDHSYFEPMYRCPKGDVTGKPTLYTYYPPTHRDPQMGDVLLSCPFHPENRVVWTERLQSHLDYGRKVAAERQKSR